VRALRALTSLLLLALVAQTAAAMVGWRRAESAEAEVLRLRESSAFEWRVHQATLGCCYRAPSPAPSLCR